MNHEETISYVDLNKTPPRYHEISVNDRGAVWHREFIFTEDADNPKGDFLSSRILEFLAV